MKTKHKTLVGIVLAAIIVAAVGLYLHHQRIPVLQPAGSVGNKERGIIIFAAALSLAIMLPVFTLLGVFAYKYRETSRKAKYTPELGGSKLAETIWWVVPSVLIIAISIVTWQSSYALDPYKPIGSETAALHVQVVALDWKWLFIYPAQHIATVNQLEVPVNVPVSFDITSDTVMNSFWIPSLGGQMYAMPGMNSKLHLIANKPGTYLGRSANISGVGFSGMTFNTHAVSGTSFDSWVKVTQAGAFGATNSKGKLATASYAALAKPSQYVPVASYSSVQSDLYDNIMMKYMMSGGAISSGVTQ